jgi:hypothetical protein
LATRVDDLDGIARRGETPAVSRQKAVRFSATVHKLGINPCVDVPHGVVGELRRTSGKEAGPIPVRGRLNGKRFSTTVVRYAGGWRLYLNTAMRAEAAADVGDELTVEVAYDRTPRIVPMPPRFAAALAKDPKARAAFEDLAPSHRKDILNYLNSLKTAESLERSIKKAIAESLAGRDAH